ncbi:MAG: hypothetical protein INR66_00655 [Gordonia polyisoprenivorans]|nr:hypothetical protein [Gordonia polyisoprenivorans]
MSMHPIGSSSGNKHSSEWWSDGKWAGGDIVDELQMLESYSPGDSEKEYPAAPCRPLGSFSSFVVDELHEHSAGVWARTLTPEDLFERIEQRAWEVARDLLPPLIANPTRWDARVAAVDLAWAERAMNVAFGPDRATEYRARRDVSRVFTMGKILSGAIGRYPFLQWTDIAEAYPCHDPRTFLSPGHDRLQEIHLYIVQSAIERGSRRIVEHWTYGPPSEAARSEILQILGGIAKAMANLSRRRQPGEFDKLDRYLCPNDEVIGHGTGSFSAWTKLAGFLCTGRMSMLGAITDPHNWMAYSPETWPWITAVLAGRLSPMDPRQDVLAGEIERRCTSFHLIHLGAVKRHGPNALSCPAPSMRSRTNLCAMKRNVEGRPEKPLL